MRLIFSFFYCFYFLGFGSSCHDDDRSSSIDLDLLNLSIDEIIRQITDRRVCCVDLTRYFLNRIEKYNPIFKGVVTVDEIGSLRDAEKLDSFYKKSGARLKGRLHCVPALIKDNIFVKGLPTTLGVRLFSNATADEDAPVVAKLRKEGAIILGKANMIMFAAGATDVGSETGGLARNPYALNFTVVGSSTGNAVALAARLAVIGLGSDSGGSVTAPASAVNVVGLRPSSGGVDMRAVFPLLGQPFDTVGPMALNVPDVMMLWDILRIGGNRRSPDFDRSSIRIGLLYSLTFGTVNVTTPLLDAVGYFTTTTYTVDPEIQECFHQFQNRLDVLSAKYNIVSTVIEEDVVELAGPVLENENYRWSCIVPDMSRFLKQYPMRSPSGEIIDNADRIASHRSTPAYYRSLLSYLSKRANSCTASRQRYARYLSTVRRRLKRKIFGDVDVVIMPTLNALPWPLLDHRPDDSQYPHANGHLHDLGGLFALPALNLPLCFSKPRPGAPQGLPIGGYFMTLPENMEIMLEFAKIFEGEFKDTRLAQILSL